MSPGSHIPMHAPPEQVLPTHAVRTRVPLALQVWTLLLEQLGACGAQVPEHTPLTQVLEMALQSVDWGLPLPSHVLVAFPLQVGACGAQVPVQALLTQVCIEHAVECG